MSTKALSRLVLPLEVKASDQEARTFEGMAAAYSLDLGGDVIHPGAFRRTLDHWKSSGRVIPLLDMHPYLTNSGHSVTQHTLGKLVDAGEEDGGLRARFQVAKTAAGDDLMALLRDGMVEGLSIGYKAINPQHEGGVRHLREVALTEVSVVTFGMNPDAVVDLASVKSLVGLLSDLQRQELITALHSDAKAPEPGLAPEDPKRLLLEESFRALTLRGLGARV